MPLPIAMSGWPGAMSVHGAPPNGWVFCLFAPAGSGTCVDVLLLSVNGSGRFGV